MQKKKSFFITFEGADGVGKTTQCELLAKYLKESGKEVVLTREPGGTAVGEKVRRILLDPACLMDQRTEALLYLAVRAEHVAKIVEPALAEGKVVISDRFSDSTFVYQGLVRGTDLETLKALNDFAAACLKPDLTFLLDAPVEVLQNRLEKRKTFDRIEKEGLNFQKLVREGFLQLAKQESKRIVVLDALANADEIQQNIRNNIQTRFLA